MRLHRVYTDQSLEPGHELVIGGGRAHYLARVLRVTAGQAVVVFNGDGHDYAADVIEPGKKEVSLRVNSRLPAARESTLRITVAQAISRGERMDQTLQKCTELGVAAFSPLLSERVEVRLAADKLQKRLEHWRGVVISACEQCGRAVIPEVSAPVQLSEWLVHDDSAVRLALSPGAERALSSAEISGRVSLIAGPEGGFSDKESAQMRTSGVQQVSLGPRILRTETAAAAGVAVLQALAGDFR